MVIVESAKVGDTVIVRYVNTLQVYCKGRVIKHTKTFGSIQSFLSSGEFRHNE